jgi:hypothetical protein
VHAVDARVVGHELHARAMVLRCVVAGADGEVDCNDRS